MAQREVEKKVTTKDICLYLSNLLDKQAYEALLTDKGLLSALLEKSVQDKFKIKKLALFGEIATGSDQLFSTLFERLNNDKNQEVRERVALTLARLNLDSAKSILQSIMFNDFAQKGRSRAGRSHRAKQMLEKGEFPISKDNIEFTVQRSGRPQYIVRRNGSWTCTCPDHEEGYTCKHILSVNLFLEVMNAERIVSVLTELGLSKELFLLELLKEPFRQQFSQFYNGPIKKTIANAFDRVMKIVDTFSSVDDYKSNFTMNLIQELSALLKKGKLDHREFDLEAMKPFKLWRPLQQQVELKQVEEAFRQQISIFLNTSNKTLTDAYETALENIDTYSSIDDFKRRFSMNIIQQILILLKNNEINHREFDLEAMKPFELWRPLQKMVMLKRIQELKTCKVIQVGKKYDISNLKRSYLGNIIATKLGFSNKKRLKRVEYQQLISHIKKLKYEVPVTIKPTSTEDFFSDEE